MSYHTNKLENRDKSQVLEMIEGKYRKRKNGKHTKVNVVRLKY